MCKNWCRSVAIAGLAAVASMAVLSAGLAALAAEPNDVLAISTNKGVPIALKAGPVEVALAPPPGAAGTLAARLAAIKPGVKLYLVLRALRTNEQPEVIYQVYLGLPANVAAVRDSSYFVGTFNFFNAATRGEDDRFFSYEVTDLVRGLQAHGSLGESLGVTIVPAAKPNPAATPMVGEIALVRQ